jgi:ABC-type branched-subunit amino acid transport system permease subunit
MNIWVMIAVGGMLLFIGMIAGILIVSLCCTSHNSHLDSLETENRILRERLAAIGFGGRRSEDGR